MRITGKGGPVVGLAPSPGVAQPDSSEAAGACPAGAPEPSGLPADQFHSSAPLVLRATRLVRESRTTARLQDIESLVASDPTLRVAFKLARKSGVTIGVTGSTARDLLLGRQRAATSDLDLVFDSRQPGLASFRKGLARVLSERGAPPVDFYLDLNPERSLKRADRGLTIDGLQVLSDGTCTDPTGQGLDDLAAKTLRYFCEPPHEPPGISRIFRMIKVLVLNPGMSFEPDTKAEIQRVMNQYYGPDSENVRRIRRFGQTIGTGFIRRFIRAVESFVAGGNVDRLRVAMRKWSLHGRKQHGENYVDIMQQLEKILKAGAAQPERTRAILDSFGISQFLESIGEGDKLAALTPAQNAAGDEV